MVYFGGRFVGKASPGFEIGTNKRFLSGNITKTFKKLSKNEKKNRKTTLFCFWAGTNILFKVLNEAKLLFSESQLEAARNSTLRFRFLSLFTI